MPDSDHSPVPRPHEVRRRFSLAAKSFDRADFVHEVTRNGLFARIAPMTVEARRVLDLGCATGSAIRPLSKRFRGASILALDVSAAMLGNAMKKRPWFSKVAAIQADASRMPIADHCVDVVFSNLLLPWVADTDAVFAEVARVLRPGGLFAFASLGPDSLAVLRRAWQAAGGGVHVNRFADMHDLGDALVRAGLADPVLDVDRLDVHYRGADALFADLTAAGARNALAGRDRALTGKRRFAAMKGALEGELVARGQPLGLELVYGHCFGRGATQGGRVAHVDVGSIRRRR